LVRSHHPERGFDLQDYDISRDPQPSNVFGHLNAVRARWNLQKKSIASIVDSPKRRVAEKWS